MLLAKHSVGILRTKFRQPTAFFCCRCRRGSLFLCTFYLHVLVLGKRLCFSMATIHPFLKLFLRYMSDSTKALPTFLVIGKICLACFFFGRETIHHFVLVKTAVFVHLVNDKHITLRWIVGEEHVDMVAINTLGATNVAVGIVHRNAPLLTTGIGSTTNTPFWILDGNVIAINLHMSFLVVTGLFLCFGRVGVNFSLRFCNLFLDSKLGIVFLCRYILFCFTFFRQTLFFRQATSLFFCSSLFFFCSFQFFCSTFFSIYNALPKINFGLCFVNGRLSLLLRCNLFCYCHASFRFGFLRLLKFGFLV